MAVCSLQLFAMAALVDAVPVAAVDGALAASDRVGQRVRTLPPWVTTYHVLATAMEPSANYDDITELMWSTLPSLTGRGLARQVPSRGAVTRARLRLGHEPLRELMPALSLAGAPTSIHHLYLQKRDLGPASAWWLWDAVSGHLLGCEFGLAATVECVASTGAVAVVVCPTRDESALALAELLGTTATVAVGELPQWSTGRWGLPRGRTEEAAMQEMMARACLRMAQDGLVSRRRN